MENIFVKRVKDVEFYYVECKNESNNPYFPDVYYKVIAHSDLQQQSAILAYENDLEGVKRCINSFSKGFDLNGFKLKKSD